MSSASRQRIIGEGYKLGRRLRQFGATPTDWRENVDVWGDGPGQKYRRHELRAYFVRGLEAGFHDLVQPAASSLDQ